MNSKAVETEINMISSICLVPATNCIRVSWWPRNGKDDGNEDSILEDSSYPYVYLRDNCQCPQCFHPGTIARLLSLGDLDPDEHPANIELADDKKYISVTWSSGHGSQYEAAWLYERRFNKDPDSKLKRKMYIKRPIKLWGAEIQNKIPTENYQDIISDNAAMYRWLVKLEESGIALLKNAPKESGVLATLGEKVGFLKKTDYWDVFGVRADVTPTHVAYTNKTLALHTDQPWLLYAPGMQMLHCIIQTPAIGGENIFSDAFNVAEQLRKDDPATFEVLSTIPLGMQNVGKDLTDFEKVHQRPVFQLSREGDVEAVYYSNHQRDSIMDLSLEQVDTVYKALIKFHSYLYDERNLIKYKMEEGDIICFHNNRVLHGRAGFTVTSAGQRHLEGAYIDWDALQSRRRLLETSGCSV